MDIIGRIKALLGKPVVAVETDIWASTEPAASAPVAGNPWKESRGVHIAGAAPKPLDSPWKAPTRIGKNWVLHKAAFAVILLNVVLALFFTSNNQMFNAALYTYLGASTILLSHYWGLTR